MSLIATDGAGTRTITPVTVTPIVVIEPDANPTYGQSAAINSMVTAGLPTNAPPSASIIQATSVPFTPASNPQVNNSISTMSSTMPQSVAISSGSEPDATPNGIPMTPISALVASGAMSQPSVSSPQSLPMGGGMNTNWGATTSGAIPEPDATPSQSFGSGGAVVLSSGLASSLGVPVGSTITSGTIITPSASDIRDVNNASTFASFGSNQSLPMGAGFRDASFNSLTDQSSIITPTTKPSFDITQVPIGANGKPDFEAYYAAQNAASVPAIKTITTLVPNEDYYHIGNVNVDASVWNSASDQSKFSFLQQQGVIPQGSQFIPGLTSQNIAQLHSQGEDTTGLAPTTWGYYTPTQLQTQQTALAEQGRQVVANFNQNVAINQHNAAIAATNTVSPATQAQINTTMATLNDYKSTAMPSSIVAPAGYNSGVTGYRIQQAVWDGKVSIADLASAGFDTSSLTTTKPNETPTSNLPNNIVFPAGYETGVTPYNTQIAGDRGYVPISNIAYGVTPTSPYRNSATGELNRGSGAITTIGSPQVVGGDYNTQHNGSIFATGLSGMKNLRSDFENWYHNLSPTDREGAAAQTALAVNTAASGGSTTGNLVEVYNPNNPSNVQLTNAQMGAISSSVNDSYLPMGVKAINAIPVVGALNTEVYQLQNTNINPHTIEMNAIKSEGLQAGALIIGGGFGALTGGITTAGEVAATGATEAGLDTGAVQGARIAAQQAGNTIGMTDAQIANATNMGVDLGNSRWGNIPSEISSTTRGIGNIVGKVGNSVGGVLDQYEGEGVVNNTISAGKSFNQFWNDPSISSNAPPSDTLFTGGNGDITMAYTGRNVPLDQSMFGSTTYQTSGDMLHDITYVPQVNGGANAEGLNISNINITGSAESPINITRTQLDNEVGQASAYQKTTGVTQSQIDSTKFPIAGTADSRYYMTGESTPRVSVPVPFSSIGENENISIPSSKVLSNVGMASPLQNQTVTNPMTMTTSQSAQALANTSIFSTSIPTAFATENFVPSFNAITNAGTTAMGSIIGETNTGITEPSVSTPTTETTTNAQVNENTQTPTPQTLTQTQTQTQTQTPVQLQTQTPTQNNEQTVPPDEEIYEPNYKTPLPVIPLGGGGSGIGGGGGGGNSGYESPSSLETKSKIKPELTLNLPNPLENKRYKKVLSPEEAIPAGFRRYNGTRTLGGAL